MSSNNPSALGCLDERSDMSTFKVGDDRRWIQMIEGAHWEFAEVVAGIERKVMSKEKVDSFKRGRPMDHDEDLAEGLDDVTHAANSIVRILYEGREKLESYHDEIDQVNEELMLYKDSLDDCTRELKRLHEMLGASQATLEIKGDLTTDIQKAILKSRTLLEKVQQILNRTTFWEGLGMIQETIKVLKASNSNFPLEGESSGVVSPEINAPEDTETNPAGTVVSAEANAPVVALDFLQNEMVLQGLLMDMRLKQRESSGVVPPRINAPKDMEGNPAEAKIPAADALAFQLRKISLEGESSGVDPPETNAPENTETNPIDTDVSAEANAPADANFSGDRDGSEEAHVPAEE